VPAIILTPSHGMPYDGRRMAMVLMTGKLRVPIRHRCRMRLNFEPGWGHLRAQLKPAHVPLRITMKRHLDLVALLRRIPARVSAFMHAVFSAADADVSLETLHHENVGTIAFWAGCLGGTSITDLRKLDGLLDDTWRADDWQGRLQPFLCRLRGEPRSRTVFERLIVDGCQPDVLARFLWRSVVPQSRLKAELSAVEDGRRVSEQLVALAAHADQISIDAVRLGVASAIPPDLGTALRLQAARIRWPDRGVPTLPEMAATELLFAVDHVADVTGRANHQAVVTITNALRGSVGKPPIEIDTLKTYVKRARRLRHERQAGLSASASRARSQSV
jgi:hypothetical protein